MSCPVLISSIKPLIFITLLIVLNSVFKDGTDTLSTGMNGWDKCTANGLLLHTKMALTYHAAVCPILGMSVQGYSLYRLLHL